MFLGFYDAGMPRKGAKLVCTVPPALTFRFNHSIGAKPTGAENLVRES